KPPKGARSASACARPPQSFRGSDGARGRRDAVAQLAVGPALARRRRQEGPMSLSIAQLMKTNVVALAPNETLSTGLQRMTDWSIRHLPIVDGSGALLGIVSQRDLVRAIDVMRTAEGTRQHLVLGDVMKRDAYKATPSLPAHEGAAMMIEHKIGILPVVDE